MRGLPSENHQQLSGADECTGLVRGYVLVRTDGKAGRR